MVYDFEYYLKNRLVKKSSRNAGEAKALLKRARQRLNYVKIQAITEENAMFIFEDIYEAIREAVQSLMALKGFKPYSHEVLIAFLNKFYSKKFKPHEVDTFNRYRILRNNIVYRASSINKQETEKALVFALMIVVRIENISSAE